MSNRNCNNSDYGGGSTISGVRAGTAGSADTARLNFVSGQIVDAAVKIHSRVGPGLVESVYETILCRDLVRRGLCVERQKPISFEYDGMWFENVGRADIIVEDAVIVEVKSAVAVAAIHQKQLLTYLRLLDHRLGLVLNFGAPLMKDGIHRIANRM
ncbi:GxxExxY protein [soil metagenome]